jgi:hypothetical protein
MSIIKTALVASVLSLAVVATASAQYNEKIYPNGDYVPMAAPSSALPAPIGQTRANGDYVPMAASSGLPAPIGETPANGDYVRTER